MSRRSAFVYCLGVFLAVRIGLALIGWLAVETFPSRGPVSVPGWPEPAVTSGAPNIVTSLERQDALWFLHISQDGYGEGGPAAAFFPLYPTLTGIGSMLLGGHPLGAAMLISNLAALGALWVMFLLTEREYGIERARRSVLYLAVYPSAFFLYAPYSEALYLLAAVASFWGARRGRWWLAGVAGFAAALTRSVGIVLAPALAVEALHQWREGKAKPANILWSLAPLAGTATYLAWWQARAGDWSLPLDQQSGWDRAGAFPLTTIAHAIGDAWSNGSYWLLDLLVVAPVAIAVVWVTFRARPAYAVFAWASLLIPLAYAFPDRPLMSVPRFAVVIFPAFWAFSSATEHRRIPHDLWLGVSVAGFTLMAMLFANNWFVF